MGETFLGEIPLHLEIRENADNGTPIAVSNPDSPHTKAYEQIAQKIIQLALDNEIEIHQDADLVQILKAVDINEEIPVEAFAAVAEIISYIYQQNGKTL